MILFENEGINVDIKDSFLCYLLSSNRPLHEMLDPIQKDFSLSFTQNFEGMCERKVTINELVEAKDRLVQEIHKNLTTNDRDLLISFLNNNPKWSLFRDEKIKNHPSIKWKLHNQKQMDDKKRLEQLKSLEKVLSAIK